MPSNAQPTGDVGDVSADVAPEEQKAYEMFMANVGNVMFDQKTLPKLVARLRSGDPVQAVAQAAVQIVARVEDSAAQKTGAQVDPDILLNAGREAIGLLAEIASKTKIHEFTDQDLEAAYTAAVDMYRDMRQKQGKINPADFKPAWDELVQANASGTIDKQYPAVAAYAKHVKEQGAPEGAPPPAGPGGMMGRPQ